MSENIKTEIVEQLIGAMPEPTPAPPPPIPAVERGPDGKPALNSKGKVRGRPGRPSKNRTAPTRPAAPPAVDAQMFDVSPDQDTATSSSAAQLDAAAVTCALAWQSVGLLALGADGKFADDQERDGITEAIRNYLAANGITDVPPGVALTIAAVGYVGARLHRPTVADRLKIAVLWIRAKLGV